MTYTIEQLRKRWCTFPLGAQSLDNHRVIIQELIDEVEERTAKEIANLTRELRAQEITTINERLRTARECAEIAWELAESSDRNESFPSFRAIGAMTAASAIRHKFEVPE